ncbi:MAG: DnaJ domain-containing protein [Thermoflexales bacterium]
MELKDYYAIMQVSPDADAAVIAAAYRALAARYHPDRNKSPDATLRMQELNEAYAVLSDAHKRDSYDRKRRLHAHFAGSGAQNGAVAPTMHVQDKIDRALRRIREIQDRALEQVRQIQERTSQQVREIQERSNQQVREIQERAARQIQEIQARALEQIRDIQDSL